MKHNLAARMAHWSAHHRKLAIFGWLALVLIVFVAGNAIGSKQISDVDQFSGESHRAEQALDRADMRPTREVVFLRNRALTVRAPEFRRAIAEVSARLATVPHVENVRSPLTGGGTVSPDGHAALVDFQIAGDSIEAADRVDPTLAATAAVQANHPDFEIEQFGAASAEKAINETINDDLAKAGELSLPITLIILVLTFGTLVAAGIPLLMGITAVIGALGVVAITSHLLPIDSNLSAVILLIGLAVGVDYSLFYLRREREERAAGREPEPALAAAAATSGRAVLISGMTVIAAMAGMFLSGDNTFMSFAEGTIIVVAIAMFASLTLLPALLSWLGDRVEKGRVPLLGRRRRAAGQSRFWSALVGRVMHRPGLSLVLAGGLLVLLAIPALGMKTVNSGVDDLPQDLPVIVTYDKVRAVFPVEGVVATVVVEADDVRSPAVTGAIARLAAAVDRSDAFLPGTQVTYSADGTVAQIDVPTVGNGTDTASVGALDEIRDEIVPATVGTVQGTSVNVTGDAASSVDFNNQLNGRLPLIFAFVFALAFLLMLVTFRSLVIPLTAIVLNLLSVGAAYGILVLIFQDGNLESLIGFSSNGGVTNWLPLFLFVVLFGLSMDYHVFILSRVRELHDRGMPTAEAVRQGISTTAGTVTSAAVVMVGVFAVFATLSFIDFKELGIGLAVAVLIDATIVRGVLVPASMKLLGDWNWYLPRWLEWLPRVGAERDTTPPPPPPRGTGGKMPVGA
ncbi:MMPL family transporter [Conexibacter stalactiti]|uniref:MMPL family transporter n=1 Tax=Conexibacter stalactiti TaxID=1940611 RepID=A0ABU4HY07_9ACTN|nr:MMPL family transporter [Conexibacter stalactiti]MDW5598044.1 MMPL family transporter [Conexibacter stalactiti]MEC5038686.1 MMPL family transporter [Conexibacter stalactiti]